jgi:hypothetical protein
MIMSKRTLMGALLTLAFAMTACQTNGQRADVGQGEGEIAGAGQEQSEERFEGDQPAGDDQGMGEEGMYEEGMDQPQGDTGMGEQGIGEDLYGGEGTTGDSGIVREPAAEEEETEEQRRRRLQRQQQQQQQQQQQGDQPAEGWGETQEQGTEDGTGTDTGGGSGM